jgi:enoyl-CoA hydratase
MTSDFPNLSVEQKGEICWATIDRQTDRNSINSDLMAQIGAVLVEVESTSARALVFTGAGKTHFIGGADGIEMMQLDRPSAERFSQNFQDLLSRMEDSPLLIVAAINGLCFGGGFEFAMACDLRVAVKSARIGLPEVKVGLIPGGGGTQRLPRLVGSGLAMEMILGGKLYEGEKAAEMGLVHRVVDDDALVHGVEELLAPIFRNPQYALSLAKLAVKASQTGTMADGLAAEAGLFSRCHDETFFHDLMVEQLGSGQLSTTEDKEKLMRGKSK